ncbi:MAG: hypothetical protein IT379_39280 [Deltaproteobacteria bacterium]|nr:hypothetical protein [Deltaproteobacteria bacterium]
MLAVVGIGGLRLWQSESLSGTAPPRLQHLVVDGGPPPSPFPPSATEAAARRGVEFALSYDSVLATDVVVIDIVRVAPTTRRMDVIAALLDVAEYLRGRRFARVLLARGGARRFELTGEYFAELGGVRQREVNPMFLLRSIPGHARDMDGGTPYPPARATNLMGAVAEMERANDFVDRWVAP